GPAGSSISPWIGTGRRRPSATITTPVSTWPPCSSCSARRSWRGRRPSRSCATSDARTTATSSSGSGRRRPRPGSCWRATRRTTLDEYIARTLQDELGVPAGAYALEQELRAAHMRIPSPTRKVPTHYVVFPIDVWVHPERREPLRERLGPGGRWITCEQAAK